MRSSAEKIYKETSEKLSSKDYSCQQLLKKVNAEVVCTTEDPTDNLEHHKKLAKSDFSVKVSTAFRPDKAILIESDGYNAYLDTLGKVAEIRHRSFFLICVQL